MFFRRTKSAVPKSVAAAIALLLTAPAVFSTVTTPVTADAASTTSKFTPVTPCRLLDTRLESPGKLLTGSPLDVQITGSRCGIPTNAVAAALTLTITGAENAGWLAGWPADEQFQGTSLLNWTPQTHTIANAALLELSPTGRVKVQAASSVHLVVDISGYFVSATSSTSGRFEPVTPRRLLDTRNGGRPAAGGTVRVSRPAEVPADAVAMAVTITTTATHTQSGYFTTHPSGADRPNTSNLNTDRAGQTRAAGQIVPINPTGFDVYSSAGDHVIVDVTGYFTGNSAPVSTDGLFVASSPTRVLDTRTQGPQLWPGGTREINPFTVTGGPVAAVVGNWTITRPDGPGWVAAYPARTPRPDNYSTLNTEPGSETIANMGIIPTSTAGVSAYSSRGTHLVVDITGWFTGAPRSTTTSQAPNNPPASTQAVDPLGAVTSPNKGTWCAAGTDASSLNSFFASARGSFYGADYQRAYRLPDGRVLWMFQDAFITNTAGAQTLQHNVGMIQSGRCFTLLRGGTAAAPKSWIMWDKTTNHQTWYWPMGGTVSPDGTTFHLFMAEMQERGTTYLSQTEPTAMYIANIRISDLRVTGYAKAPNPSGADLYGWSATEDGSWTYLYSHCYRQFGWGWLGHDPCTQYMKVARVPKGQPWATPQYWNGSGWVANPAAATPVVSSTTFGTSINPGQVIFDGTRFVLIVKEGDWWGSKVFVGTSPSPTGPWTTVTTITTTPKCADCNTYFASWIPWRNPDGRMIWGLSHNRWDGAISTVYRPTIHSVTVV